MPSKTDFERGDEGAEGEDGGDLYRVEVGESVGATEAVGDVAAARGDVTAAKVEVAAARAAVAAARAKVAAASYA